jgi:hypothetical protein
MLDRRAESVELTNARVVAGRAIVVADSITPL